MDPTGRIVSVEVDPDELGQPGGEATSMTVIRGRSGSSVLVPLEDGRPLLSREGLERPPGHA